jgi:hypothetical protein
MRNERDGEEGRKQLDNSLNNKENKNKSKLEGISRINRAESCWNDERIPPRICFPIENKSINGEV